jgi:glyoxylase-like metal-dependent hydrolase (beta-lactamase superfamily II)
MTRSTKRVIGIVGAVVTLCVAALGWQLVYRPVLRRGQAPAPPPYSLPAPVAGLRLHVFNTGMNRMSAVLVGENRPWRPVPAFVIEHPTHGLIVFDAGLPAEVAAEAEAALGIPTRWVIESRSRPGRTLAEQMQRDGLSRDAVRSVIVSHLHEDHLGSASAFREADFLGGAGTPGTRVNGWLPSWREVDFTGLPALPPFDAASDLFGDGSIVLIPGGGHTREDLMALVALPSGPVLLAGDAVVHRDWLVSDDVQRVPVDADRAAAVRNQVRALLEARADLTLVPGHDLSMIPAGRNDIVLHRPEWFGDDAWPLPE